MRKLLMATLLFVATMPLASAAPLGKKERAKLMQEAAVALKYASAATKMKAKAERERRRLPENDSSDHGDRVRAEVSKQSSIEYDQYAKIMPILD